MFIAILKSKLGVDNYEVFKSIILSKSTPSMESIRRVRQKTQEDGNYISKNRKYKLAEAELVSNWSINT